MRIEKELPRWRELNPFALCAEIALVGRLIVLAWRFGQTGALTAVQVHAIQMEVIGTSFGAVSGVIDPAGFFIDSRDANHRAWALGELANEGSLEIVKIDLIPAIALGEPEKTAIIGERSEIRRI
jgi:hypothetical protein